jgi:hypothetical protein
MTRLLAVGVSAILGVTANGDTPRNISQKRNREEATQHVGKAWP